MAGAGIAGHFSMRRGRAFAGSRLVVLLALGLLPIQGEAVHAGAAIEAYGELPADTTDASGETIGGIGSGIAFDPESGLFLCVSDRGPADGALPYTPRIVALEISQSGKALRPKVVRSILLRDERARAMSGLIPDDPLSPIPRLKDGRTCIDPEAIAVRPGGTLLITDEYGPYLYEFDRDGVMLRRFDLPERYRPVDKKGRLNFTDKARLVRGRAINQGPEGLCLSEDGARVVLLFQSNLVQDGGGESGWTRLLVLDLKSGVPVAEYAYPMTPLDGVDAEDLRVNDIQCLGENRFLVLERDSLGRNGRRKHKVARDKSVWLVDTRGATDLQRANARTPRVDVAKRLVFNLPDLVPDRASLSAKWEGLVSVPPFKQDEVTLLMTADNDFLTPVIFADGREIPFPRVQEPIPTQIYKIRARLPEIP